jgi:uncharacterized protein (TIGR02099 family)
MPTDQRQPADSQLDIQPVNRLRKTWRSMQQAYRYANNASYHAFSWLLKLLLLGYFVFCALFLTLRYAVLPHIDTYRTDVEQVATKALGLKVTIGEIGASWQGLRPRLSLANVIIHEKDGGTALQLPSVSATLSWWSLAVGELRLRRLEIVKPDLDVQRDAQGNFYVAGLRINMQRGGDGQAANWVLSQNEITIRDGKLRWQDNMRQAPELLLGGVDIVLRNQGRSHQFALKATPPKEIAEPLDVRASFIHPHFSKKISDATLWTGQLYTDLRNTDLAAWKTYIDFPFDLQQAKGSMRAWLTFDHARVVDFTADLSMVNVIAQLRRDLQPLQLETVSGRVSVRDVLDNPARDGKLAFGTQGHMISLVDFSLKTSDGLILPKTTISEQYAVAQKGSPERTEVQIKQLDLQTLANFVGRLPLTPEHLRMLADFAPRGQLNDFSAQWQGAYPNIASYKLVGQFNNLAMNAQPARVGRPASGNVAAQVALPAIPGFENLSGRIDADNQHGALVLASDQLKLSLPSVFDEPDVVFDQLKLNTTWTLQKNDQLFVNVQNLDFARQGMTGSLAGTQQMSLSKPAGQRLGVADIHGTLNGLELNKVGDYLPLAMKADFRDWLSSALVGGTLRDGLIRIKGDMANFPFHTQKPNEKPKGEFIFSGKIDDGVLNYAPGMLGKDGQMPLWPLLEKVKGTIVFDRTKMEIIGDTAMTHNARLSNVKAVIPDLLSSESVLEIDGKAAGALQDLVQYTVDSPVAGWIGHFTDETKASGDATLALKLSLPLHHLIDAKVLGLIKFNNNNVTLQNIIPTLTQTSGQLEFNETGLTLNGIKATALGGPVTVIGGSQKDGNILIKADGTLSGIGLRKAYPAVQQLADRITGSTRYGVTVAVKSKRVEITAESNLRGLGLNLPAPMHKAPNDAMPLKFELATAPSDSAVLRDSIKISLGSTMAASYLREKNATDNNASWRMVRGGVGVNTPVPEPDSGLGLNVSLRSLNIDDWIALTSEVGPANTQNSTQKQAGNAAPSAFDLSEYVTPTLLAARATELVVMDKKLDQVVVGASREKGVWQVNVDSTQTSGYLTWIESSSGRGLGKVTARLTSLIVPKTATSDVKDLLETKDTTTEMPALDIVAEQFELFDKKLGRLELTANYVRAAAGREWRIRNLSLNNPDANLTASGSWLVKDGGNTSNLTYNLNIVNAGNLLARFGYPGVIRGGKGKMDGDISWRGLPFSLDVPSMSGNINLDLASGQFLKVDPGAAKLLGVLSLQSLPRRLTLDFRDLFSEGFAFDGITGSAAIKNGVATTDNFKMRGVNAVVLIGGTADVDKETQDLRVVVIPEINAGAASVAYAAINPVIGLGTFLAQLLLRGPLAQAFTFEYTITGPWSDPAVIKVDRKAEKSQASPLVPTSHAVRVATES